jgi:hypothetical protein
MRVLYNNPSRKLILQRVTVFGKINVRWGVWHENSVYEQLKNCVVCFKTSKVFKSCFCVLRASTPWGWHCDALKHVGVNRDLNANCYWILCTSWLLTHVKVHTSVFKRRKPLIPLNIRTVTQCLCLLNTYNHKAACCEIFWLPSGSEDWVRVLHQPCTLLSCYHFAGIRCLHIQGIWSIRYHLGSKTDNCGPSNRVIKSTTARNFKTIANWKRPHAPP